MTTDVISIARSASTDCLSCHPTDLSASRWSNSGVRRYACHEHGHQGLWVLFERYTRPAHEPSTETEPQVSLQSNFPNRVAFSGGTPAVRQCKKLARWGRGLDCSSGSKGQRYSFAV